VISVSLALLLCAHVVGDYYLQGKRLAEQKHSNRHALQHSGDYSPVLFVFRLADGRLIHGHDL
jgi:hypothetical protein